MAKNTEQRDHRFSIAIECLTQNPQRHTRENVLLRLLFLMKVSDDGPATSTHTTCR